MGVEAQTAQGVLDGPIGPVPRHGTAQLAEMGADLVLPPGLQIHLQQGKPLVGGQGPVAGDRLPAALGDRVDLVGGVLPQEGADGIRRLRGTSLSQGQISPAPDQPGPVVLEGPLHVLVLGEEKNPGGVPVQPVDDKDPPPRRTAADVGGDRPVSGALPLLLVGHGQEPCGLVHRQKAGVLIEQGEGQRCPGRSLRQKHHRLTGA